MPQIDVISPSGELGTVDASELRRAVGEEGYRVATSKDISEFDKEHQYGEGLDNSLKAGLEGAARGVTFGASDYLLPKLPFGPTTEALSERKNRHPVAGTVGEIGGVLGSSILVPGGGLPGLVAKAGRGAEALVASRTAESILGSIGKKAVGSAIEGAFYGAGNVVSEEALGDPALTGQKALSQIGLSGLLTGGLGGALKAASLVAPKVASMASEGAAKVFDKASSFVSGLPEAEVAAMRTTRGLDKAASEAASGTFDVQAEALKKTAEAIKSQGDLLKGGLLGTAAHALGIPKSVIGAGVAAYSALNNPELTMKALSHVESLVQKATKAISQNTNAIFTAGAKESVSSLTPYLTSKVASSSLDTKEALGSEYAKAVDQINEISSHPELFMDAMDNATSSLYPHAPNVVGQIQQTAGNAIGFLQGKIPRPVETGPLSTEFVPSQADMGKFMHYYSVVNDPIMSLKELRMGTLGPDTIETMTAVHPKLYEDMKQQVMDKVLEKRAGIPYQKRLMLSMFLQEPLDISMSPSSMLTTQGVYASPAKSNDSTGATNSKAGSTTKLAKLNVASRAKTPLQKVNLGDKL